MPKILNFTVNGKPFHIESETDQTLLHVLRNRLGLKATRFGCGQEECGACMVLVDGDPKFSCTLQVGDCVGRNITTAESLAGETPHPLHEAFLAEQAGQCGYCLSGILISAAALLNRQKNPTQAEIIEALEPHLCRCGAHVRMLRAVERAAAALREGASA